MDVGVATGKSVTVAVSLFLIENASFVNLILVFSVTLEKHLLEALAVDGAKGSALGRNKDFEVALAIVVLGLQS